MVLVKAERLPQRKTLSRVTFDTPERQFLVTYNSEQIGQSELYISNFLHRPDVAHTFTLAHSPARISLERKEIVSATGETHQYLVVRQGKKRFLFDMPEDPTVPQEVSEMTLVVPKRVMEEKGLLPRPEENHFHRFRNNLEAGRFLRIVEQEGYFAGRESGAHVEDNSDFIQPVPALLLSDAPHRRRNCDTRFTLPIRNTQTGANVDNRLSGMIVAPFAMGHSDVGDFGQRRRVIKHAFYREVAEETELTRNPTDPSQTFSAFQEKDSHPHISLWGIMKLRQFYRIRPFGIIYTEERNIDKVHVGFLMIAEPKTRDVRFALHNGSAESVSPVSLSFGEYTDAINRGQYQPASWNHAIFHEGLAPYLASNRRKCT